MRRVTRGCVLFAVASVALAGCGSSAPQSSPPSPSASAPATSATSGSPSSVAGTPPATGSWLSYHYDQARTGAVPAGASLDRAARAWSADLGGAVYGQPLVADGKIIAATENEPGRRPGSP